MDREPDLVAVAHIEIGMRFEKRLRLGAGVSPNPST